jgi:hypothetical protein
MSFIAVILNYFSSAERLLDYARISIALIINMTAISHAFDISFLNCPCPYIFPTFPRILIEDMEQVMAVLTSKFIFGGFPVQVAAVLPTIVILFNVLRSRANSVDILTDSLLNGRRRDFSTS